MRERFRWFALMTVILTAHGATARAQYGYYPPGYAGYGWGGWGGGASSLQGDVARGLGVFAAGAGVYNQQTAVARSINADTAMRWNQYVWQSQQEANQRHYAKMVRNQRDLNKGRADVYERLRNEPSQSDIKRGDALNVAADEINNPKYYLRGRKGMAAKVPGMTIRDIPFQYASAAITTSVEQLVKGGPPESLKAEVFNDDRAAMRALAAQLRKQNEETGQFDPATLEKTREQITKIREKVEATYKPNTPQRTSAEKYLKGLYGLTRMLQTPAINVLLSGVEKRPDTTLGDLLTFMKVFNLRFGAATTPRQEAAYQQIYPLLVDLRKEVTEDEKTNSAVAATGAPESPGEFFSGMEYEHLQPKPPAPGTGAAPK